MSVESFDGLALSTAGMLLLDLGQVIQGLSNLGGGRLPAQATRLSAHLPESSRPTFVEGRPVEAPHRSRTFRRADLGAPGVRDSSTANIKVGSSSTSAISAG